MTESLKIELSSDGGTPDDGYHVKSPPPVPPRGDGLARKKNALPPDSQRFAIEDN